MPHSLSAAKRVRQNAKRNARNQAIKSRIHTARRNFDEAVEAGDADRAGELFRQVQKLLHRAADNGPLHKNTAARRIGSMQKKLDRLAAGDESE